MSIIHQMTTRIPNFIEQSQLETNEGMLPERLGERSLTFTSLERILVTDIQSSYHPVSQSVS